MESSIPEEIKREIFLRLPGDNISPSTRVCRTWRRLLRCTDFVDTHLQHQVRQQQLLHDYGYGLDNDGNYGAGNELYHKGESNNDNGGGKVSFLFMARSYAKTEKRLVCYGEYFNDESGLYYKTLKRKKDRIKKDYSAGYSLDFHHHAIVGSCNGLICLSESCKSTLVVNDPVHIFNPITGEEVNLPKLDNPLKTGQCHCLAMACGFGYLPSTDEYKVVRIYYRGNKGFRNTGQVEVYTLGRDNSTGSGWRYYGEIIPNLLRTDAEPSLGVLSDGALHWLDTENLRILAFDLAQEEFFEVPSPPCFERKAQEFYFYLLVLGGCLYVVHQTLSERVDFWSFKMNTEKNKNSSSDGMKEQDYKCSWIWSLEFSIPWEGKRRVQYHPFALTKTGELLLWYNQTLSLFDPKKATLKKLTDGDLGLKVFHAIPHVDSLVSLKTFKSIRPGQGWSTRARKRTRPLLQHFSAHSIYFHKFIMYVIVLPFYMYYLEAHTFYVLNYQSLNQM